MSVEIRVSLICDGCGTRLEGPIQRTQYGGSYGFFITNKKAQKQGWVTLFRYRKPKDLCRTCDDAPKATGKPKPTVEQLSP